jgi:hypothetical protein
MNFQSKSHDEDDGVPENEATVSLAKPCGTDDKGTRPDLPMMWVCDTSTVHSSVGTSVFSGFFGKMKN